MPRTPKPKKGNELASLPLPSSSRYPLAHNTGFYAAGWIYFIRGHLGSTVTVLGRLARNIAIGGGALRTVGAPAGAVAIANPIPLQAAFR